MEVTSARVSDDHQRTDVDLKRKRAARFAAYFTGAARSVANRPTQDSLPRRSHKRMRSEGCHVNVSFVGKSILKGYSNFMKSGLPQRLLFYYNLEWVDFPKGTIDLIKEDFLGKKTAIQLEHKGREFLFDFIHMVQVDMKTGLQHPLAWIDESGSCFFPESFSDVSELHDSFSKNHILESSQPSGTQEIKLRLEIDVSTNGSSKFEECSGESNMHVKGCKIEGTPARVHFEPEEDLRSGGKQVNDVEEVVAENMMINVIPPPQKPVLGDSIGKLAPNAVKHMLTVGMNSVMCMEDILEVRSSGTHYLARARLELFEKQVEIIGKCRGYANVQYAWLSCTKELAPKIFNHGLRFDSLPKTKSAYENGVILAPANCPCISARYCDVDENGIQHIVLCRVILGNMEVVHPGSSQMQPSGENFDSGVDDYENPKNYVIWTMNMTTHIYPEFFVSFRMSSSKKGRLVASESKFDVSGVTNCTPCQGKLQLGTSPANSVGGDQALPNCIDMSRKEYLNADLASKKTPKSPWMSFPSLFAAIVDKVPNERMRLLYFYHHKYRERQITRDFLVEQLRMVVGDELLRSTLLGLKGKQPPNPTGPAMVKVKEEPSY
ncbi:hypothetical protein Sjap_004168 [Stephania japonica]|uniref:Inactive poly [ADP-ribose] polymerase RCD1 n=1 Tax=Stephania japonica TaxID=461633 RepID=A0AAP0PK26_9MAGN